jgi:hypothetical protein
MINFKQATVEFFQDVKAKYGLRREVKWIGRRKSDKSEVMFLLEKETNTIKVFKEDKIIEQIDTFYVDSSDKLLKKYEVAYLEKSKKVSAESPAIQETDYIKIAS